MRTAKISRKTKETDITVKINLDENNASNITTGIGFFDHMLMAFATHCGINLEISVDGDLEVDAHHTVEDVGIVLGQALRVALDEMPAIERYGSAYVPMDEALGFVSLDICRRPFLVMDAHFTADKIGEMDTQLVTEFFRAFAFNSQITLHAKVLYGENDHHKAEALFKALAHALKQAIKPLTNDKTLSTKGTL
ncbi:MAG: imidazoleglycerol-phosphate dehydratase HisB [Oscillospiraceae bacterium]